MYSLPPYMQSLPIIKITHQRGAFVAADELKLTHRYHLESIVGLGAHPLCCAFYGFGQMFDTVARIHHYSSIQNIFAPRKASVLHLFIPPSPLPLQTTDLFIISIVLPFPECLNVGNIQ